MACGARIILIVIIISANYYNHKLPKYFSRFWNPNSSGVHFFFQSLSRRKLPLVVSPLGIVLRVLHYLKSQQAVGTFVVPLWRIVDLCGAGPINGF